MTVLIVLSFIVLILYIGFSSKKTDSILEYLYSGRKLTAPALIATLVTTWYGAINDIGIEVTNYGIVTWIYYCFFYYIAALLYAYLIAPKILKKNYNSIPISIYETYGKTPALICLVILFFYLIPAPYLLILGQLINEIFSLKNLHLSIFLGLIVSTIYTMKGGLSSIIKTDKIQFLFMFTGFIILSATLFLSNEYGFSIIKELKNNEPQMFEIPGKHAWSYIGVFLFLSLITFIDPAFHQRTFAAKNLKTIQRSILYSIFFWFIFDFMTITSALFYYAITYGQDISSISSPYVSLARIVFEHNDLFMGIFFISLLSVVMSTIDSYTFLSSSALQYDLNRIIGKEVSLPKIKLTILFVMILSFFLSIFFDRALDYWYHFGTFVIISTLIPMLCILFDIKFKNAKTMIIFSVLTTFIWEILIINQITTLPSIYVGLIIGVSIFIYEKISILIKRSRNNR